MENVNKEINKRILHLREHLKLSQEQFGEKIAIVKSGVSNIEKGTRNVNDRIIKLICTEFNVSEEWLRTGQGEMFIITEKNILSDIAKNYNLDELDQKIITQYIKLNEFQRKIIKDYIKSLFSNEETTAAIEPVQLKEYEPEKNYTLEVPLVGKVAGGQPILAVEEHGKKVIANTKCDCALELIGDSMEPEYMNGDILLVSRQPDLENGDCGIILILDGADIAEATFKRFYKENGKVILKPINPKYPDIKIEKKNIMIFGKVVGKTK